MPAVVRSGASSSRHSAFPGQVPHAAPVAIVLLAAPGRATRCQRHPRVAQRGASRVPAGLPQRFFGKKILDEEEFVHDVQSSVARHAGGPPHRLWHMCPDEGPWFRSSNEKTVMKKTPKVAVNFWGSVHHVLVMVRGHYILQRSTLPRGLKHALPSVRPSGACRRRRS